MARVEAIDVVMVMSEDDPPAPLAACVVTSLRRWMIWVVYPLPRGSGTLCEALRGYAGPLRNLGDGGAAAAEGDLDRGIGSASL
jgi:hypothetical protein